MGGSGRGSGRALQTQDSFKDSGVKLTTFEDVTLGGSLEGIKEGSTSVNPLTTQVQEQQKRLSNTEWKTEQEGDSEINARRSNYRNKGKPSKKMEESMRRLSALEKRAGEKNKLSTFGDAKKTAKTLREKLTKQGPGKGGPSGGRGKGGGRGL
ncbi:hypothetical protein TrLO_g7186 [Triparma laevis f. longispina]|uniref:Uncharacterized protein n=1 Tax=Triparma laevis f. longispina TaxID=1714387 RepID=A0A9W7AUA6_9STRA|nr:hypothetical protein TrLO_g7186 [Triparma laevis f. longispina]